MSGVPSVSDNVRESGQARRALRRVVKRVYHSTRQTWERTLHPLRHRAALRRLSSDKRPKRILVVCYGNVCRSPYLRAALARSLADVQVTSAGFVGSGRRVPTTALEVGKQRDVDLSDHRSTLVSPSTVSNADLVIVMDPDQARRLNTSFPGTRRRILVAPDLAPTFMGIRAIRDPWNQPPDVYESVFDHLDACVATLAAILGKKRDFRGAKT